MKLTTSCTGHAMCIPKPINILLSNLILLLFISIEANAQSTLNGRVIDSATEEPLINATVQLKGSTIATRTDENGKFTLQVKEPDGVLEVSYLGYQTREVPVQDYEQQFVIALQANDNILKEVEVNTGYQTIPKERATGSFSLVTPERLEERTSPDIINKLDGVVSGLIFNKHGVTGQTELMIRGRSTIFANEAPLIVLDNFPYEGDIANINPNDIESITVLKDAAAASIWGVRAGNGVIVINSKKGKFNRDFHAQVNTSISVGTKPDLFYSPNFLPSSEFIEMEQFLFDRDYYHADLISTSKVPLTPIIELLYAEKDGKISSATTEDLIEQYKSHDIRRDRTDHLFRNAVNQQYSIQISGGSERHSYRFSSGYDRNVSNQIKSNYSRITLNARSRLKLTHKLLLNIGLGYVQNENDRNSGGINLTSRTGRRIYPYARLVDDLGNPAVVYKDYRKDFVDAAQKNGLLNWRYSPLDDIGMSGTVSTGADTRVETGLAYSIGKGFSTEVKYLYQNSASQTNELAQFESYLARDLINRYASVTTTGLVSKLDNIPLGDILDISNSKLFTHNLRGQLNFNQIFDQHEVNAIVGMELKSNHRAGNAHRVYGYDDQTGSAQTVEQPTKSFLLYPLGFSAPIPNPQYISGEEDRFRSYYTNIAYSYKNYTFSGSARIDQSNFFGVKANQRSVPLWSSGFKWTISDETFYNMSWLPNLSFRTTYGYNGNLDRSLTGVTTIRYYPTGDILTDLQYADLNSIGNPSLRWEKTSMLNIGVDFQIKDNVISGSLDYFRKWGRDLIGDSPMPPSTGVEEFRGNFADMNGQGVDLELNSININRTFKWRTSLHFSFATDKIMNYGIRFDPILYLGANGNTFDKYPIEGYPLYSAFSLPWGGLDPKNGNPLGFLSGALSDDYRELNNPTLDDIIYHGPAKPTIFGSLYNHVSFSNFSLSFNVSYKLGYYFRRSSIDYNALFNRSQGHVDFSDRWRQPGDESFTGIPSMVFPNDVNRDLFYHRTSALVERGDHIRLQYISLSYDLSEQSNPNFPIHGFRFYFQMENLGILWRANKRGIDPDYQAFSDGVGVSIPEPLIITTGLKLTF